MVEPAPIVLASSSVYRKQQMQSLGLKFTVNIPDVDESAHIDETPSKLASRLAFSKAQKIKTQSPAACVIGSDQVCAFGGRIFGKPGSEVNATKQLQTFSNNCIEFFTALCVIGPIGQPMVYTDLTVVWFRELSDDEIKRYIASERPLDCAGSFKVESLGLSLFESVESSDPSALMGMPLIKLCEFLRTAGYQVP